MGFIINLNKPMGLSSHDAVSVVKKTLRARKAGHAGTLDPIATGVLLICIDNATKISRFLSNMDKQYSATLRLGQITDTYDSEGTVMSEKDLYGIDGEKLLKTVKKFEGAIQQVPPMYSAIKKDGRPLYKLARKGDVIERESRSVEISRIEIIEFQNPFLKILVECSKGTYVRSLAHDIGLDLGCGAHICALERTRVGHFDISGAAGIDGDLREKGLSIDEGLCRMQEIVLTEGASARAKHGAAIDLSVNNVLNLATIGSSSGTEFFRLKDSSGELFAIGRIDGDQVKIERNFPLKPKGVF